LNNNELLLPQVQKFTKTQNILDEGPIHDLKENKIILLIINYS